MKSSLKLELEKREPVDEAILSALDAAIKAYGSITSDTRKATSARIYKELRRLARRHGPKLSEARLEYLRYRYGATPRQGIDVGLNKEARGRRDTLYRRLNYLERRDNGKGDRTEAAALRWALKIVEEADLAGLILALQNSDNFGTAGWLQRREEADQREREKSLRAADKAAALSELNEPPDWDDAMRRRLPGSFEGGKR